MWKNRNIRKSAKEIVGELKEIFLGFKTRDHFKGLQSLLNSFKVV